MQHKSVTASEMIAAEIRGHMAKKQVTQAQLATELDMSQPAVARRLSGRVPLSVDEVATIAGVLGETFKKLTEAVDA